MTSPSLQRFVALASCLFLAACAPLGAQADDFIISYWCGPPAGGDYNAQYAEVAQCNFTHACFPCTGTSVEQNKAILDACQKHGLKFIPADGRLLNYSAADPKFAENLDAVLADYAKHPALGGYFLGDEPGPDAFARMGDVNKYLLKKDPNRLPFINLLPSYVPPGYLSISYEEYVEQFCAKVQPKLLCYDFYALFEGQERDGYFENMELIRRKALEHGAAMGFIFQTTPHGTYRDPSETDLRWQVNTALAYGANALFYFTYFTPTDPEANFHNGILDATGKRTAHYDMAKRINAELKQIGPTLAQLTSTAVYHTAPAPAGSKLLPDDAAIRVSGSAPLILGFFKHKDGSDWAIIVNRDLRQATSAQLSFAHEIKAVEALDPVTGKLASQTIAKAQTTLELPPGGIKIFKLTR